MFFPLLDGKVKNSLLLYFSVFLVYLCLNAGFLIIDSVRVIINYFLLFYLGFFRPLLSNFYTLVINNHNMHTIVCPSVRLFLYKLHQWRVWFLFVWEIIHRSSCHFSILLIINFIAHTNVNLNIYFFIFVV